MRSLIAATAAALVLTAVPASAAAPDPDRAERAAYPALRVTRLVTGLDHPWDVRPVGDGRLLFTQRDRATLSVWEDGDTRPLDFPSEEIWVSGETGLMGLEVDPDFATNHRVYTCAGGFPGGDRRDVRVVAWQLDDALTRATKVRTLVSGFPAVAGRHGGCRLLIDRRGSLLVGTGDAAIGSNPRNLRSFGGKTLRLDRFTGKPWPSNPFVRSGNRVKRYVYTYGHRNVQGLAERGNGTLWSVEQGSTRDDEVNRLVPGGDYGWHPVPGYDESVPMTDQGLPGRQRAAVWRSGYPTLATSGGDFVTGPGLGAYDGTLAVAVQKEQRVLFLTLTRAGKLRRVHVPDELRRFGRIRTVVDGPGSTFYVTTDNGGGSDAILMVRPAG